MDLVDQSYHGTLFVGELNEMCSKEERDERERMGSLSRFEVNASETSKSRNKKPKTNAQLAVASFCRSSAGSDRTVAKNIRDPATIQKTMNYLLDNILNRSEDFWEIYDFLSDRFRAMRQECIVQNCYSPGIIQVHEQMARFHIISSYKLQNEEKFNESLNTSLLTAILTKLRKLYDEGADRNEIVSENEAEFRAYELLLNLQHVPMRLITLKRRDLLTSKPFSLALTFYNLIRNNNFVGFFTTLASKDCNYLFGCLLFRIIASIRNQFLNVINIAYKKVEFPVVYLQNYLGFDSREQIELFCSAHNLTIAKSKRVGNECVIFSGLARNLSSNLIVIPSSVIDSKSKDVAILCTQPK